MNKKAALAIALMLTFGAAGFAFRTEAQPLTVDNPSSIVLAARPDATQSATLSPTAIATQQPFTRINLNTGTDAQFLGIPTMNARMVKEYQEYRPYTSILQFRKEIGKYVGADQTTAWEKYIYVPIKVDSADAETLKQIPGVDDTIAKTLIAGEPYKTNDDFLVKLATLLTPDQVDYAKNYLDGYVVASATAAPTAASTAAPTAAATVAQ